MIKTILKRNNIPLAQFASDLNISRPTLDSYIERYYDSNNSIPNHLFKDIFDFLFSDTTITNEMFLEKYRYVTSYYGKRNIMSETPPPAADTLPPIGTGNVYDKYLSYKSGQRKLAGLTAKEKKLFAAIYRAETEFDDGDTSCDEAAYNRFEEKCRIEYQRKHAGGDLKSNVISMIEGMDAAELEKLLKLINEKQA